jgi:hypothetical protein
MQLIKHVQEPIDWDEMSQLFQMKVGPRHLYGYFDQDESILVEVKEEERSQLLRVNPNITLRYLMCELWGPQDYQVVDHWTRDGNVADGSTLLTMMVRDIQQFGVADLTVNP